jgi:hypothetical protein
VPVAATADACFWQAPGGEDEFVEAGASSVATALHAWLARCLSATDVHLPRTKRLVSRYTDTQAGHEALTAPPSSENAPA